MQRVLDTRRTHVAPTSHPRRTHVAPTSHPRRMHRARTHVTCISSHAYCHMHTITCLTCHQLLDATTVIEMPMHLMAWALPRAPNPLHQTTGARRYRCHAPYVLKRLEGCVDTMYGTGRTKTNV